MTIAFWILASIMVIGALALVLPPMLGRGNRRERKRDDVNLTVHRERLADLEDEYRREDIDEAQYKQARAEAERALLADVHVHQPETKTPSSRGRSAAIVIGIALPVLAVGLYRSLGLPAMPPTANSEDTNAQQTSPERDPQVPSVEQMVAQLEQRLNSNPDDLTGWIMLGRSYTSLERIDEARDAYARARDIDPDNPEVLLGYAEAIARLNGNRLTGEPSELIQRTLQLAPDSGRALLLAGIAAFQAGDNAQALSYWEKLKSLGNMDDAATQMVDSFIAQASGTTSSPTEQTEQPSAPVNSNAKLEVHVTLSPQLADKAAPDDTVFVFARAADGPRMPLAIVKKQVKDLPATITLDDSTAMAPEMKISKFPTVVVGARVSKTGNAMPSTGDLQGLSGTINVANAHSVQVLIENTLP